MPVLAENNSEFGDNHLSVRHHKGIKRLLWYHRELIDYMLMPKNFGKSASQLGKLIGKGRGHTHNVINSPLFQKALQKRRDELFDKSKLEFQSLASKGVEVLSESLDKIDPLGEPVAQTVRADTAKFIVKGVGHCEPEDSGNKTIVINMEGSGSAGMKNIEMESLGE